MLHVAETLDQTDPQAALGQYLTDWQSLERQYGSRAVLMEIGADRVGERDEQDLVAAGIPIVWKSKAYFDDFATARDAFRGQSTTYAGPSGYNQLAALGAVPSLIDDYPPIIADQIGKLQKLLGLVGQAIQEEQGLPVGPVDPYALIPPQARRVGVGILLAAGAAAAVALASGAAVVIAFKRRR